uniref:Transport permease protein n=1 Tax=Prevotella sp. GTC17254 TaxID=3236794 RepID=A0AB33J8G9_9BACT
MILKYLIRKEFIQMRRNSFLPRLIVMFPIVIMCVIPWVASMEVRDVAVRVVDHDHSQQSVQLIHRIEASRYFSFQGISASYTEALQEVEKGRADAIVEIPRFYARDIAQGKIPQVLIAANAVNGMKGSLGASYLGRIVVQSLPARAGMPTVKGGIVTKNLYNPHQDYKVFMIPALMAMIMIMICGFVPALNIVGEKEAGTIEQINVTPVSKFDFIMAKLIPFWLIGMVDLTVCLLISWLLYGLVPAGNVLLIYLLAVLLAVVFSSIGLIVSNYSDTMQQAMLVMWFILMCMMLLSGLFTPTRSMPDWAQGMVIFIPVHYFIDGMRAVFVHGAGFTGIATQLSALFIFALLTGVWAVVSYRKNS